MWVTDGVPHCGCDTSFKILRDDMFKPFSFFVDFIPCVAKRLHQPGFEQAVVSDNFQRGLAALFC